MNKAIGVLVGVILLIVGGVLAATFLRGDGGDMRSAAGNALVGRSDTGGRSWMFDAAVGSDRPFRPGEITFIAFSPHESHKNFLFAGTSASGLFWSGNNGRTWERIGKQSGVLGGAVGVFDIAFDPRTASRWYLAAVVNGVGSVLATENNGQSFSSLYHTAQLDQAVLSIDIDPFASDFVYAATAEGLLLESNDRGREWKVLQTFPRAILDVRLHPRFRGTLYAVTENGLLRSRDHGRTVQSLQEGLPGRFDPRFTRLELDPLRSNVVLLASADKLFRSTDGGDTWRQIPLVIPPETLAVRAVAASPHTIRTLYAAAASTVYISRDDGDEWEVQSLPVASSVRILVPDPRTPERLFVAVEP